MSSELRTGEGIFPLLMLVYAPDSCAITLRIEARDFDFNVSGAYGDAAETVSPER